MKKETISFRKRVSAGQTEVVSEELKQDGEIQKISVRFYAGQERDLRVYPYVKHVGDRFQPLVTFANEGEKFLSGDDDYLEFETSIQVSYDDEIHIRAENISSYDYDLVIDVIVQYFSTDRRLKI